MTWQRLAAILVATCGIAGRPRSVVAAPGSRQHAPAASSKVADAARHFRRGVELYEDGDLSAASVEFTRANQILPSFKVFYNLGQISHQRRDYVEALYDFRRYLDDGGDQVAIGQRNDIEQQIQRLEERIGRIAIESSEEGAQILLDDIAVGTTPLSKPILASVGRRKVEKLSTNGARQVQFLDVVGGETRQVVFRSEIRAEELDLRARPPSPDTELSDAVLEPTLLVDSASREESPGGAGRAWIAWSAAGLLGAGAVASGALAFDASRDLRQSRQTYPLVPGALASDAAHVQLYSVVGDCLLIGTVLATAAALYLTFSDPDHGDTGAGEGRPEDENRLSLKRP